MATFLDANGVLTDSSGVPVDSLMQTLRGGGETPGDIAAAAQQAHLQQVLAAAPPWQPFVPPELTPEQMLQQQQEGRGGPPVQEQLTEQQLALMGQFGEDRYEQAGQSLLNYLKGHPPEGFADVPEVPAFHVGLTGEAQALEDRMGFPNDLENRVTYGGPGVFRLDDSFTGADLLSGQLPMGMDYNRMPRALQPLLGPSMNAYFGQSLLPEKGGAPHWSRFWAPPGNQLSSSSDKSWPGVTKYDAWHRSLGEYANLYS